MALRWLFVAAALLAASGCLSEEDANAALRSFCLRNEGTLLCENNECPCASSLNDSSFVCFAGTCRVLDGGSCLAGVGQLSPQGAACGCKTDCVSGLSCIANRCE